MDIRKIYNKGLGISAGDVMKCEDLEVLRSWRMAVAVQRSDLLAVNGVRCEGDLLSGEKKKALYLRRFETVVYRRMKEVQEMLCDGGVSEAVAFQEACKRILPGWQYELILQKSREKG